MTKHQLNHVIGFRLTDAEHELLLLQAADGETPAKAARRLLLGVLVGEVRKVSAPSRFEGGIERVPIEALPALSGKELVRQRREEGKIQRGWLEKPALGHDESGEAMSVREVR